MTSNKLIVEKFSENLLKDSAWKKTGSPTIGNNSVTVSAGDTATQVVEIPRSNEEDAEQQVIYGFQFTGLMSAPAGAASVNTLGTLTVSLGYSDGTDESMVYVVSRPRNTTEPVSRYMFNKFDTEGATEVYPTKLSISVDGFEGATFSDLSLNMSFGMMIDTKEDEIPANLLRNSSFEIMESVGSNAPLNWSGDATLGDIAHAIGYKGITDAKSLHLSGSRYMESAADAPVGENGMLLSWHTVGDGATFEVFGSNRRVIHSGNVGSWPNNGPWLMQYAVLTYSMLKDAGSIGVRFRGKGGNAYIDGIKLEEITLPGGAEWMAWPTEWVPHVDDTMDEEMGDKWLKSFKVGTKELIGSFDDYDVDSNDTPEPIDLLYDNLQEFTGLNLELYEDAGNVYSSIKLYTGKTVTGTYAIGDEALTSLKLPLAANQTLEVMLTDVPFDSFDDRIHAFQKYAVNFTRERVGTPLKKLTLGTNNILGDHTLIDEVGDEPTYRVAHAGIRSLGLIAELNSTYSDYVLTVVTINKAGVKTAAPYVAGVKYPAVADDKGVYVVASDVAYSALLTDPTAYNYLVYGVLYDTRPFKGLVNIKCKDDKGLVLHVRELEVDEPGVHEIEADELDGYTLISESPIEVTLTNEEPEVTVEFVYEATGESVDGYVLEFATATIRSLTTFTFSNREGYDSVESITLGIINNASVFVNLAAEPVRTGDKYTGITVRASNAPAGAQLSMQAICYNWREVD